jgi:RimJ/RimL family protein N-acetyltransferase
MATLAEAASITAPDLQDGIVRLRPWPAMEPGQLRDAVQESLDTVSRWQPWCGSNYDLGKAREWIEHSRQGWLDGSDFSLAVCDADSGELLGGIGMNQINRLHRSANMGYWMRQSRQGQGLTPRACALLAQFGFGTLGLIRIEIVAEPDNLPSRRVAEKLGARFEAVARQRLWIHEQARDAAVYALLPGDLAARNE